MENTPTTQTVATNATEKLIIKDISLIENKEGQVSYVLHTTPSKTNPPRNGEKESRFVLRERVFERLAKSKGLPMSLFAKDAIGGTYVVSTKAVKAGDKFLNGGEGTYTKDHNAIVSQSIELSSLVIAEDRNAERNAYYASKYAKGAVASAPVMPVVNNDGSNIEM